MDFQISQKFFRFQIQYSKYTGLGRTLSSALISGRGSGDLKLEHIAILVSLIVWNLNNDRPPACKIENFVTINCEFSLSRLNGVFVFRLLFECTAVQLQVTGVGTIDHSTVECIYRYIETVLPCLF